MTSGLLIERARFETMVQQLSIADIGSESDLKVVVYPLLSELARCLEQTTKATSRAGAQSKTITQRIIFPITEEKFKDDLRRISELNNQLQLVIETLHLRGQLKSRRDDRETSPRNLGEQITTQPSSNDEALEEILASLGQYTGESVDVLQQRLRATSIPAENSSPNTQAREVNFLALQHLGSCCGELLKQCGRIDARFVDVSNGFELWRDATDSEGFYEALDQEWAQNWNREGMYQRPAWLVLRTETQMGQLLGKRIGQVKRAYLSANGEAVLWTKETKNHLEGEWRRLVEQCITAMSQARSAFPALHGFDLDDLEDYPAEPGDITTFILSLVERLVNSLTDCLPAMIDFSRQFRPRNSSITASEVAELLGISVNLLEPASIALSAASKEEVVESRQEAGEEVDFNSIQRQFEEQAAVLRKWKEKNIEDIEIKLGPRNPAKFASVADAVGNIARLLGESVHLASQVDHSQTNSVLRVELQEISATGGHSPEMAPWKNIASTVKQFEVWVQSLEAMEHQLKTIDMPPPYASAPRDPRVFVDISGNIRLMNTTPTAQQVSEQ
jgi:hypothetical protein